MFAPVELNGRLLVDGGPPTDIHRLHEGYFSSPDVGIDAFSYLDDYFILAVTGGFNIGSGVQNESRFKTRTLQVADDLTMVRGNHQFGFGFNVAQWDSYSEAHVRSPGSFSVNSNVRSPMRPPWWLCVSR